MLLRPFFFFLFACVGNLYAQQFGIGASLHRYDQVLSFNYQKECGNGVSGGSVGLGVERSLQGALAPSASLYWKGTLSKARGQSISPIYTLAYQIDFQKSTFFDLHQGVYLGLGFHFGNKAHYQMLLQGGLVRENLIHTTYTGAPVFLNPQLLFIYFLPYENTSLR